MLSRGQNGRDIMQMVWLEDLVPKDHLLRKIEAAVEFDKIYEMVEELYCEDNGRPSIDPVDALPRSTHLHSCCRMFR